MLAFSIFLLSRYVSSVGFLPGLLKMVRTIELVRTVLRLISQILRFK